MLYPFEQTNCTYLNAKCKQLEDKIIPDTLVSVKVAKKHIDTSEMKDRVVQESLEHLTLFMAANSRELGFPEMTVGLEIVLRKFRKNCTNANYRKYMLTFLDTMKANEDLIKEKREKLKDRTLKSNKIKDLQLALHKLLTNAPTPLEKERNKIMKRR